ncbi:MAG: helix-turn-helix transcriptional regulator [Gemmatimonadota bacterium]|nr:helix-turn-helix transcriptional regulator [Gemmatimonadota bacterium]
MRQPDPFDRILASLHDATIDPDHWPTAAGLIDGSIGLKGNALAICSGVGRTRRDISLLVCFGGRRYQDLEQEYFREYWSRDERIRRFKRLRDSELVPTGDLYTDREKETSSTYNELLSQTDMQNGFHVCLDGPGRSEIVWALSDCTDTRGWSSTQIEGIQRLLPHIRHFASVRQVLADAKALSSSVIELLDNSRTGVIQLDRRGRIVEANDLGATLLRRRDGLVDSGGFLRARMARDNGELRRLLGRALPPLGVQASAGSMTVGRASNRTRLAVYVSPVAGRLWGFQPQRVAVLVLVVDPDRGDLLDPNLVGAALGLTPAESRIAVMLAGGKSPRTIAVATGRAEGTVRWHLKRIFRKLRVSRQAELVRQVLSLGSFPQDAPKEERVTDTSRGDADRSPG